MILRKVIFTAAFSVSLFLAALQGVQANLRIDVDDRGAADAANTEPGFEQFLLDGTENDDNTAPVTRSLSGIDITIAHSNGGAFGDRRRTEPTNAGAFSEQELLRDFIFSRGTTPDDGLDITVANLVPLAPYNVRIWSFDTSSNDNRVSDWTANGVLVQDDYTFNGVDVPPDPADNDVYAFDFSTTADAAGQVVIEGRYVAGPCCGVFVNAMSVELVPEPSTSLLASVGLLGLAFARRRRG